MIKIYGKYTQLQLGINGYINIMVYIQNTETVEGWPIKRPGSIHD